MLYEEFKSKVSFYANKKEHVKNNTCSIPYLIYKTEVEPKYLRDTSVNNASEFCKKYCMLYVD